MNARRTVGSLLVCALLVSVWWVVSAGTPTVSSASLECNTNHTLTLSANAADNDGDLTTVSGGVERYASRDACNQGTDPVEMVAVFSATEFGENEFLGGADTIPCKPWSVYRGTIHAEDVAGGIATAVTECCTCSSLPRAPTWIYFAVAGALLAVVLVVYLWWRRRR